MKAAILSLATCRTILSWPDPLQTVSLLKEPQERSRAKLELSLRMNQPIWAHRPSPRKALVSLQSAKAPQSAPVAIDEAQLDGWDKLRNHEAHLVRREFVHPQQKEKKQGVGFSVVSLQIHLNNTTHVGTHENGWAFFGRIGFQQRAHTHTQTRFDWICLTDPLQKKVLCQLVVETAAP